MNRFFPLGAQKILAGQIDFVGNDIKVAIVASGYTYSDAHEFLSAVAGVTVGAPLALTTKNIAGGVLDADDLSFGALAAGNTCIALVMYRDTGNASTSPLIAYFDQITGFPLTTNGGALGVPWADGVAKILSLV